LQIAICFKKVPDVLVFLVEDKCTWGTLFEQKAICNKSKASDAHKHNTCMLIRVN